MGNSNLYPSHSVTAVGDSEVLADLRSCTVLFSVIPTGAVPAVVSLSPEPRSKNKMQNGNCMNGSGDLCTPHLSVVLWLVSGATPRGGGVHGTDLDQCQSPTFVVHADTVFVQCGPLTVSFLN